MIFIEPFDREGLALLLRGYFYRRIRQRHSFTLLLTAYASQVLVTDQGIQTLGTCLTII